MRVFIVVLAVCFICRIAVGGDENRSATKPTTQPAAVASATEIPATSPASRPVAIAKAWDHITTTRPTTQPMAVAVARPTTRPADVALSAFEKAIQKATAEKNSAISLAITQYKTDLQAALNTAMGAANLDDANRDKAEMDRINGGAEVESKSAPAGTTIALARKKYDLSVKKANAVIVQSIQNAKRKCTEQLNSAMALALKNKDLDEANRIKILESSVSTRPLPRPTTQPDTVPPVMAHSDNPHSIDLLSLVDLKKDVVEGEWRRKSGALENDSNSNAKLSFAYQPPKEYDFIVVFTRLSGRDQVVQYFPVGATPVSWHMGSWGKDMKLTANDKDLFSASDKHCTDPVVEMTSVVKVRAGKVEIKLSGSNGETIAEFSKSMDFGGLLNSGKTPDFKSLGISTWYGAAVRFSKVELVEISGPGMVLKR